MRAFLGVTDLNWYRQLTSESLRVPEVNFWFPGGNQAFAALTRGELFVFKTHVSRQLGGLSNRIVGVGTYSGFARLRLSEAWDWFGPRNGVADLSEFRSRIGHYRGEPVSALDDPEIGCALLENAQFFSEDRSLPCPEDFSINIVRGKRYELQVLDPIHPVAQAVRGYLNAESAIESATELRLIWEETHGEARLTIPRVGQQAFKALTAEAYHHRCALTGDKVRPVLEAAHIFPVAAGGQHRLDNGLLLRSDMHTLFDRGYIGVDPKYRLRVSPALRSQFGNGDWLYAREGIEISVPERRADRPNREFLEWHNDSVFLA